MTSQNVARYEIVPVALTSTQKTLSDFDPVLPKFVYFTPCASADMKALTQNKTTLLARNRFSYSLTILS